MKMTKKNLLFGLFLSFSMLSLMAQTAEWRIEPKYKSIERIGPDLFKVKDRKMGLIDANGREILEPKYDRITPFYEGTALIYDIRSEGMLLRGIMTEDREITLLEDRFYLFPEYPFFSEGLLPVIDPMGKQGYIDSEGNRAFPFITDEIHPFSEGVAAVGEGDDFRFITTSGESIFIELPGEKYAYGGANYYNGKSLVWDEDSNCFVLDDSGRIRSIGAYDLSSLELDYLYRFGSKAGSKPDYSIAGINYDTDWTPVESSGHWTYKNAGGKLLTPFQYDKVEKFARGVAIATVKGMSGLLEIAEDNSTFYTTSSDSHKTYTPGKEVKCSFTLFIPEKWKNENLAVGITDADTGSKVPFDKNGNVFTLTVRPSGREMTERKNYKVSIANSGVELWHGMESYEFKQQPLQQHRKKVQASIRLNNADANSSDLCGVTAIISNPSDEAVTVTVNLTGGGTKASFANKTVTVTIPARGTKAVTSHFTVKKVELNGWCAVSTSDGGYAKRSNLELKPF